MHAPLTRRRRGAVLAGLAVTAVAGAAPALAAGPQPFLAGVTSQQQPVLVRMSADGHTVARAITTLHLHCTSGLTFYLPDGFTNTHVSTLRHFRVTYSLPPQSVDATTSVTLSGSFGGAVDRTATRVSGGTWSMTQVVKDPTTGAVTDTCTSGLVRFNAHR
jgi:hypothetical protein